MSTEHFAETLLQHELKYILTEEQKSYLLACLPGHMQADRYGRTSIASLYYDTPDRRLIRTSVEKPPFKEKIRLRTYGPATDISPVYLEIKRKMQGEVYKRRIKTTIPQAEAFFSGTASPEGKGQIERELLYFRDFYRDLIPACLIVYERTAYLDPKDGVRLTIDEAPRYRFEDLSLKGNFDGTLLLPQGLSILEIKTQQVIPLWLARILSEGSVYKCSFSKYGVAYRQLLTNHLPERIVNYV